MERLYYDDSYLREFDARVIARKNEGRTIYLDRTAFYPSSGGQPHDQGQLGGVAVVDVVDEGERIAHVLAAPLSAETARGVVDWPRRWDHMQQHTGQHLLSAVLAERFGSPTVSFHLGQVGSTIDVQAKGLTAERLVEAERAANDEVMANRAVSVAYEDAPAGLRKESQREGTLRVVTIEGLDRSACGGTHVRATGEIGLVLLGKTEKVRDTLRIEFVCGGRALRRARRDYDALSRVAKLFSSTLEEAPPLVERLQERAAEAEKSVRRLTGDLAARRGGELYAAAKILPSGARYAHRVLESVDEEARGEAQGFVAAGPGVYLATGTSPAAVLLVCSANSGCHAGAVLKEVLGLVGGKGGGSALQAQGSLPGVDAVAVAAAEIARRVGG